MQRESTPVTAQDAEHPWYLLCVVVAVALAAINAADFISTRNPGSVALAIAWLLWAFSWYAKPFRILLRTNAFEAIAAQQLRPWVPKSLWILATFGALALLLIGLIVKFASAA